MNTSESNTPSSINETEFWNNHDNFLFYEKISLDLLPSFAIRGGLNTCCDLNLIRDYIFNSQSILEIGAGYGRVVEYLLQHHYRGQITAIERCSQFAALLNQKFGEKIDLFHADLQQINFEKENKTFELILWMWSGLCDFSKEEQPRILKKVSQWLAPNGILVFDTMPTNLSPANASVSMGQSYIIPSESGAQLLGYTPTHEEIDNYAKAIKATCTHLNYFTTTERPRILHLITKS